ncbi:RND type efflux pump involved in aminoglycoside resistance [gamma proteobacterium HTCC5015]|nr:RND type efflux pump involved in aminoglycoside resistance [gamma proteobacterium HTCC5015]
MGTNWIRSLVVVVATFLSFSVSAQSEEPLVCVFDPVGIGGDVYSLARDVTTEFLNIGVEVELKPYADEKKAVADLKSGACDAALMTGINARPFNLFTSTIEAMGTIHSYDSLHSVIQALSQPKAAHLFENGEYEVVGIFPAGAVYTMAKNRRWRSIDDMEGRKIVVMFEDEVSQMMVEKLGGVPVPANTHTFAKKFISGEIEVVFMPAAVYEPMELYKALEPNGGIQERPVVQLTLQFVTRKDRFPEGFGQKARRISLDWFDRALDIAKKAESKIDPKYWVRLSPYNFEQLQNAMRDARIALEEQGVYDATMLKVLKKMRCKEMPELFECGLANGF